MFKTVLPIILVAGLWLTTAFTGEKKEKWIATLQLEGKSKPITLVSEAIHGGYDSYGKKIFFFGKDHAFMNEADNDNAQVFRDLCTTNASKMFEFEVNGVPNDEPTEKPITYTGNISFKKKYSISSTFQKRKVGEGYEKMVVTKGDFKSLGFQMTEEADKIMTGKFTLTFTTKN